MPLRAHYELEVDTTARNPYDLATSIIEHTRYNPRPDSFSRLRGELGVIETRRTQMAFTTGPPHER
jgi:hypothetical protein